MRLRIKDWSKFQHFKDRNPPWVKLYKDLLDDPDWHDLEPASAKVLVMLWLIASEDETKSGLLPDIRKLSFRLRMSENDVKKHCSKLSHWLIQDDIKAISKEYQSDAPETETETETKPSSEYSEEFERFWTVYPKKTGKGAAWTSWKKQKPEINGVLSTLSWQTKSQQWNKDNGQFIPMPTTYINQRRWEDTPHSGESKHLMLVCPNGFPFSEWMKSSEQEKSEIMARYGK